MNIFDDNKPYDDDKALLKRLGLPEWKGLCREKVHIGRYEEPNGSTAEIWVECLPAQCYTFRIHDADSETTYTLETGSGSLSDFWPAVQLMITGMVVVTGLEQTEGAG